jgi:translation initiation factor 4E
MALPQTYTLWFHSSSDNDWTIASYHEIMNFSSADEFWTVNKAVQDRSKMLLNGMFFIMRQGVKPIWEDSVNAKGGCISWKFDKDAVPAAWENMSAMFITQNLGDFSKYSPTGISISPKKNTNIIKLWVAKEISPYELENAKLPVECLFRDDLRLFKTHKSENGK